MRRPNGSGTVYKMKHKPLRKPYRALVIIGWRDDGNPIRKSLGTFATSKEAYAAIDRFTSNPLTAKDFENEKVTFRQCWEWGRADKIRRGTSQATIRNYDVFLVRLSAILDKPIKSLKFQQLQAVIDENSKDLGNTIAMLKVIMQAAFSAAIKQEIIDKNIVPMLVLPSKKQSDLHKPLSLDDVYTLWENVDHERISKEIKTALIYIYTGMRPIELFKIKLENVHLADRYMIGGVKTKAGKNRIIPIAECIVPFISEMYTISKFSRNEMLMPEKYISQNPKGITDKIHKYLKIENHLPHDFRHTFVTMTKDLGIDDFTIKKIVGHSTSQDITDVYTHKERNQLIEAVNKIPFKEALKNQKRVSSG